MTLPITNPKDQFGSQFQNLASIIRGFKIGHYKNTTLLQGRLQLSGKD